VHTFVCKFTASFPAGQSPELLPGMPVELSLGGGYSFAEDFSLPASDEFQPSGPLMNWLRTWRREETNWRRAIRHSGSRCRPPGVGARRC